MHITWDEEAWNDYVWWQFEDRKTLKRINALIKDIQRNGNEGSASLSLFATSSRGTGHAGSTHGTA